VLIPRELHNVSTKRKYRAIPKTLPWVRGLTDMQLPCLQNGILRHTFRPTGIAISAQRHTQRSGLAVHNDAKFPKGFQFPFISYRNAGTNCNTATHPRGRKQIEGVWQQSTEGNVGN